VALPRYVRITEKARVSEAVHMLGAIRGSQMRYYAQYVVFTDNISLLDVDGYNTSKVFNYTADDNSNSIGIAVRETSQIPVPSGVIVYTITIAEDGNITIDPSSQSYLL
jgi:hypothetical protein